MERAFAPGRGCTGRDSKGMLLLAEWMDRQNVEWAMPISKSCMKAALAFAVLMPSAPGVFSIAAKAQAATSIKSYEIDVPGATEWVDTKIDVRGGAKLHFTATGQITYPPDQS